MKILFLAPQPFFQERGTPIAVRLAVEVLSKREKDSVRLVTYHEGIDVKIQNTVHQRIWMPPFVRQVGPGVSLKKIACDLIFALTLLRILWSNRHQQFDLIHAVEESVFMAWLVKPLFGIPYIYDMDSSLSLQVVEKWPLLKPLKHLFGFFERLAICGSEAVVPVCDALAVIADSQGSKDTHILRDISLLDVERGETPGIREEPTDLRIDLGLSNDDLITLYIGNLESYQGVDLLIDSFAEIAPQASEAHVVIIGGTQEHVEKYRNKVDKLRLSTQVHFTGPKPISHLSQYLMQADILASPRTLGNNTPMKIYSYLHSGKPIIATDLPTHTQVLSNEVSQLAAPTVATFSAALLSLLADQNKRNTIGMNGRKLAEERYTYQVFCKRLNELYDRIEVKRSEPPRSSELTVSSCP